MPAEVVLAAYRALLAAIAPLNLPTALVGGMALAVWKHPRFTKDVDVLIALEGTDTNELLDRLASAAFRPKRSDSWVSVGDLQLLQLIYAPPDALVDIQVDLLLAGNEYQLEALARRVIVELPDVQSPIAVLSCEDLVLHKLMAGRVIDLADAAAILLRANRTSLEWDYLKPWAAKMGVDGELAQAWQEAFPNEPIPAAEK